MHVRVMWLVGGSARPCFLHCMKKKRKTQTTHKPNQFSFSFLFFLCQELPVVPACEWNIDPSFFFPNEIHPVQFPVKNRETEATGHANSCQGGRISHLEMGRTDRGIMKLLTSEQAAESWADGGPMARAAPD